MLYFANLFGHFLARESAKSIFPNIPARRPYLENRTPKPLKTHKYLSITRNKLRLVKFDHSLFDVSVHLLLNL